jgi:hypothetical protein
VVRLNSAAHILPQQQQQAVDDDEEMDIIV